MQQLKKITWADFLRPCYDPQKRYGDFNGTILDILRDERIPAEDRLWAMTSDGILDDRTLRLFACKCVRATPIEDGLLTWQLLDNPVTTDAVIIAEMFANGKATEDKLKTARLAADEIVTAAPLGASRSVGEAAVRAMAPSAAWAAKWAARWAVDGVLEMKGEVAAKHALTVVLGFAIDLISENYVC